jgi:hypothetical protein
MNVQINYEPTKGEFRRCNCLIFPFFYNKVPMVSLNLVSSSADTHFHTAEMLADAWG